MLDPSYRCKSVFFRGFPVFLAHGDVWFTPNP